MLQLDTTTLPKTRVWAFEPFELVYVYESDELTDDDYWGNCDACPAFTSSGTLTSKDPIKFNGGDTNLYGYVLTDPVNAFGITGKASTKECEHRLRTHCNRECSSNCEPFMIEFYMKICFSTLTSIEYLKPGWLCGSSETDRCNRVRDYAIEECSWLLNSSS